MTPFRKIRLRFLVFISLAFIVSCGGRRGPRKDSPSVIMVVVDALRRDRLGIYGCRLPTSPFLDSLAGQAVIFHNAFSHSSHTKLSVAALFSGLPPPENGVRAAVTLEELFASDGMSVSDVLAPGLVTLAEAFSRNGYQTGAIITNPHLLETMGFNQGFQDYIYLPGEARAKLVNQTALRWLTPRRARKFFLYLHYMDVHGPYYPPPPYDQMFTMGLPKTRMRWENGPTPDAVSEAEIVYSRALYDGAIRYWDDQFKEFFRELQDRGLLENTIVIITADHGEEFYDHHGFGHGFTVYEEVIRVPLIMIWPGVITRKFLRQDTARLLDLFPSLLSLAGFSLPGLSLPGCDLFAQGWTEKKSLLFRTANSQDFPVYAETFQGKAPRGLRFRNKKYIENSKDKSREFYRLDTDPSEKHLLSPSASEEKGWKELEQTASRPPREKPATPVPLDPQTLRALKSLGY